MMVSTKGRYALRVMVELAARGLEEFVPRKKSRSIRRSLKIFRSHYEKLSQRRAGHWAAGKGGATAFRRRSSIR